MMGQRVRGSPLSIGMTLNTKLNLSTSHSDASVWNISQVNFIFVV
jgi:hypothetical protein